MSGRVSYFVDIEHAHLGKFRRIQGSDPYLVDRKAAEQKTKWDDQWRQRLDREQIRSNKLKAKEDHEAKKAEALERTEAAKKAITEIENTLAYTLGKNDAIDWKSLYDTRKFDVPKPKQPADPIFPVRPQRSDQQFQPKRTLLSYIFPSLWKAKAKETENAFMKAWDLWGARLDSIKIDYDRKTSLYNESLALWERQKKEFEKLQIEGNSKIDQQAQRYLQKAPESIIDYIDMVMEHSEYPECFPRQWSIDYLPESEMIIIEHALPSVELLPNLRTVKYVRSKDAFEETLLKESELERLYDSAMYQICLRTIHEIFESDVANAIRAMTYNGWVNFIDRATGNPTRSCIISVQAQKDEFSRINLAAVEPKVCFRSLKGVGSSKLSGMASVVPILRINREDDRFVAAHDVIGSINDTTNLATIPWEEFEHFVRALFEKEFSINGGEVKITRTSRDRGVDAVAFDPDPIRGGKIVIQAKRYTNTVDVSAVRDLFGTVMNEGATKGILVTTSHYGPDAYAFAKDKPITLLDGGNLLHLLQKHGHRARIDLAEAKKTLLAQ